MYKGTLQTMSSALALDINLTISPNDEQRKTKSNKENERAYPERKETQITKGHFQA